MAINKKNKTKGGNMRKIKGKGDYQVSTRPSTAPGILGKLDQVLSRIPRGAFSAGGAAMGARFGGTTGAALGRRLGGGLSAITGYGDYNVESNSLTKVSTSVDMVPQFVKNDHSIRVTHREFIRDLVVPSAPSAFNNSEQPINPANSLLFPWLSRMAKQYSQYKIHGMVFVFKTMTSDYAASGPLGTVIMATNYNAIDRAFTSKVEMENSEFAVSCKPSMSLVHAIECLKSVSGETVLYVRDPAYETTDTSDKRFYDYGKFQVATAGLPSISGVGSTLGELWVSYDIEFMKPIIGGDTAIGPCPCLVGGLGGEVVVAAGSNPSGRLPKIIFVSGALLAPAASTRYSLLPPASGAVVTGDTGLQGTVVDLVGSGVTTNLVLRKNGRYIITFGAKGATTTTGFALGSASIPTEASVTVVSGTAVVTTTSTTANVSGQSLNTVSPTGYNHQDVFTYYVSGIADGTGATNYVTITPPVFTSNGASSVLIAGVQRDVTITWVSIGQNSQSSAFAPSAYP